jgi:hypothetical protein
MKKMRRLFLNRHEEWQLAASSWIEVVEIAKRPYISSAHPLGEDRYGRS